MSGHSKWCETFNKVVTKFFWDVCVCVCVHVKTLDNSKFCMLGITQPIELKFGVHLLKPLLFITVIIIVNQVRVVGFLNLAEIGEKVRI